MAKTERKNKTDCLRSSGPEPAEAVIYKYFFFDHMQNLIPTRSTIEDGAFDAAAVFTVLMRLRYDTHFS